jgi:S-adenosylmethionine:tRNA ribosyltransferase-isomerase
MNAIASTLDFELPAELAAHEPPEIRGGGRDDVRLMVTYSGNDVITHTNFRRFPEYLHAGDVLVVNASATINAAFVARRHGGEQIDVHLSTSLSERTWVVELRRRTATGTTPLLDARTGERLYLPDGLEAVLIAPFVSGCSESGRRVRLWTAELTRATDAVSYSQRHGRPIRYEYVTRGWPLSYYQTVFSSVPGSAEMPSAGRPFTHEMIAQLRTRGVSITSLVLHAGVASLEADEAPFPERYCVPQSTADAINRARSVGGRVIAVGTTVVRALETVSDEAGKVHAGNGWTDLVVTPDRGARAVDALLTGLHAPRASHLLLLEAFLSSEDLASAYRSALEQRYLWHEFGDVHLIFKAGQTIA